MSKIFSAFFQWAFVNVILPFIQKLIDKAKMKKVAERNKKTIEDLKNAKSSSDVDSAIDNIP
jgi:hypothetical protein